jgi:hypothetical protein
MLLAMERVPGWPVAFRGSEAVAAGLVTWDVLLGPRFRRVFPDTYVAAGLTLDSALRSHAAYRYAWHEGVLGGHSAAGLLGVACGPPDAPAELIVPHRGQRGFPGLVGGPSNRTTSISTASTRGSS